MGKQYRSNTMQMIISVEDRASKLTCHTKSACIREACWMGSQTAEGTTWAWGRRSVDTSEIEGCFFGTPWSNQQPYDDWWKNKSQDLIFALFFVDTWLR